MTIIDNRGRKQSVYNPIRQNERHVLALKQFLIEKGKYVNEIITPIYSIIVFTDNRTQKSDDIINNINMSGSSSKLCTSQNVAFVINKIISNENNKAEINRFDTEELLLSLNVRKKENKSL